MSHSYFHAKSSQKNFGNENTSYETFLPLHNWFDATKAFTCNFRHRALRHHTQGIELAKLIFKDIAWHPEWSFYEEQDSRIDILGKQHLNEDFKDFPDASKWYELIPLEPWMKKQVNDGLSCRVCAKKFGGVPEDYQFLCDFFKQFDREDVRSRMILWHSWGIFTCEEVLGVVWNRESDGKVMPIRTVAETIVSTNYGFIPTPLDFVKNLSEAQWQYVNAVALSQNNYD